VTEPDEDDDQDDGEGDPDDGERRPPLVVPELLTPDFQHGVARNEGSLHPDLDPVIPSVPRA
jgi:hypothetical protein